jgi:hypothetical protein
MHTPEQKAAYLNSQTACALIKMQSMMAENQERESQGKSLAYGEEAFLALIDKYGIHHNAAVRTLGG